MNEYKKEDWIYYGILAVVAYAVSKLLGLIPALLIVAGGYAFKYYLYPSIFPATSAAAAPNALPNEPSISTSESIEHLVADDDNSDIDDLTLKQQTLKGS